MLAREVRQASVLIDIAASELNEAKKITPTNSTKK
jgi:hypothetical protein